MESRTIVVGDIHGCYDELMDLLDQVNFGPKDRVVSVGDLVTKGPKNREVLELFMTDARFSAVMGNHDLALRPARHLAIVTCMAWVGWIETCRRRMQGSDQRWEGRALQSHRCTNNFSSDPRSGGQA